VTGDVLQQPISPYPFCSLSTIQAPANTRCPPCLFCAETEMVEWISALEGSIANIVKKLAGVDDSDSHHHHSSSSSKSRDKERHRSSSSRDKDRTGGSATDWAKQVCVPWGQGGCLSACVSANMPSQHASKYPNEMMETSRGKMETSRGKSSFMFPGPGLCVCWGGGRCWHVTATVFTNCFRVEGQGGGVQGGGGACTRVVLARDGVGWAG